MVPDRRPRDHSECPILSRRGRRLPGIQDEADARLTRESTLQNV